MVSTASLIPDWFSGKIYRALGSARAIIFPLVFLAQDSRAAEAAGAVLAKYQSASRLSVDSCLKTVYEEVNAERGAVRYTEITDQLDADGYHLRISRTVDTIKPGATPVYQLIFLSNSDGFWSYYPRLHSAIRNVKYDWRNTIDNNALPRPEDALVARGQALEIEMDGQACYEILADLTHDYRAKRADFSQIRKDINSAIQSPMIAEATYKLTIAKSNYLLRKQSVLDDSGKVISSRTYISMRRDSKLSQEAFDVPLGTRLFIPESVEQKSYFTTMLASGNRAAIKSDLARSGRDNLGKR